MSRGRSKASKTAESTRVQAQLRDPSLLEVDAAQRGGRQPEAKDLNFSRRPHTKRNRDYQRTCDT